MYLVIRAEKDIIIVQDTHSSEGHFKKKKYDIQTVFDKIVEKVPKGTLIGYNAENEKEFCLKTGREIPKDPDFQNSAKYDEGI